MYLYSLLVTVSKKNVCQQPILHDTAVVIIFFFQSMEKIQEFGGKVENYDTRLLYSTVDYCNIGNWMTLWWLISLQDMIMGRGLKFGETSIYLCMMVMKGFYFISSLLYVLWVLFQVLTLYHQTFCKMLAKFLESLLLYSKIMF